MHRHIVLLLGGAFSLLSTSPSFSQRHVLPCNIINSLWRTAKPNLLHSSTILFTNGNQSLDAIMYNEASPVVKEKSMSTRDMSPGLLSITWQPTSATGYSSTSSILLLLWWGGCSCAKNHHLQDCTHKNLALLARFKIPAKFRFRPRFREFGLRNRQNHFYKIRCFPTNLLYVAL
jgi:hypothetical protein